jgi:hypothetical protein
MNDAVTPEKKKKKRMSIIAFASVPPVKWETDAPGRTPKAGRG